MGATPPSATQVVPYNLAHEHDVLAANEEDASLNVAEHVADVDPLNCVLEHQVGCGPRHTSSPQRAVATVSTPAVGRERRQQGPWRETPYQTGQNCAECQSACGHRAARQAASLQMHGSDQRCRRQASARCLSQPQTAQPRLRTVQLLDQRGRTRQERGRHGATPTSDPDVRQHGCRCRLVVECVDVVQQKRHEFYLLEPCFLLACHVCFLVLVLVLLAPPKVKVPRQQVPHQQVPRR